jgi:hypothetical protein
MPPTIVSALYFQWPLMSFRCIHQASASWAKRSWRTFLRAGMLITQKTVALERRQQRAPGVCRFADQLPGRCTLDRVRKRLRAAANQCLGKVRGPPFLSIHSHAILLLRHV